MSQGKILYIHANNNEIGGADFCLFKMAREVQSVGFDIVVVLSRRTAIVPLYEEADIRVRIVSVSRVRKTTDPLELLGYFYQIPKAIYCYAKVIREEKPDIVHTNDLMDLAGNIAVKVVRIPSCHHIRMIVEKPGLLRKSLSFLSAFFSTQVICVSDGVRRTMYPGMDNIAVVYDWLDMAAVGHESNAENQLSLHTELGLDPDVKLVGCVGRLEPWKGQHLFLKASAFVAEKHENVRFLVIGGPTTNKEWYADELYSLQKSLPCSQRIHFLGHRANIAGIMSELDVMVHASITPDPLPGVVMEASQAGTVVVAANAGGIPEEVLDGETGFLYQPGNEFDMADKICLGLKYSNTAEMKRRAVDYVNKKFDKEVIVHQLAEIYRTIMGNKKNGIN